MPAGVPPKDVPFTAKSDVKPHNPNPSSDAGGETKATATSHPTEEAQPEAAKAANPLDTLTDEDIDAYSSENKIPYSRFKEVNEAKKSAETKLKDMETRYQSALQKSVDDAELRISAKFQREAQERTEAENVGSEEDPWDQTARKTTTAISALQAKIDALENQQSQTKMNAELVTLQETYPDADPMAVLGWATRSKDSLESLMKKSHERNAEFVNTRIRKILSHKKQRANAAVPTGGGGIRLEPSERPKTLKDARRMASEYTRSLRRQ